MEAIRNQKRSLEVYKAPKVKDYSRLFNNKARDSID